MNVVMMEMMIMNDDDDDDDDDVVDDEHVYMYVCLFLCLFVRLYVSIGKMAVDGRLRFFSLPIALTNCTLACNAIRSIACNCGMQCD